jgi:uncharacterized protein YndB with AHSA1/START domain
VAKPTIEAVPGLPQIVSSTPFRAPRELLYRAFVDPGLLVQWLGPGRDARAVIPIHQSLETKEGKRTWERAGRRKQSLLLS